MYVCVCVCVNKQYNIVLELKELYILNSNNSNRICHNSIYVYWQWQRKNWFNKCRQYWIYKYIGLSGQTNKQNLI